MDRYRMITLQHAHCKDCNLTFEYIPGLIRSVISDEFHGSAKCPDCNKVNNVIPLGKVDRSKGITHN